MKVGEYARYKYEDITYIGKITFISEVMLGLDETLAIDIDNCMEEVYKNDIIKSSSNIADLILPKDLMYIDISPDNCGGIVVPRIPETYCELNQIINEIKLGNYILKGVVTKEQLMENMYKVESEVN